METTVKLIILELLAGFFGCLWIGAAFATVFFLYGALADEAPIQNLLWSICAGIIARKLAVVLKSNKERIDYINQLVERDYTRAEATSAWEIVNNGGANLLLALQQTETIAEADWSDSERNDTNAAKKDN